MSKFASLLWQVASQQFLRSDYFTWLLFGSAQEDVKPKALNGSNAISVAIKCSMVNLFYETIMSWEI